MKNASQSITRNLLIPIGLGLLLPVMVTSCQGCKKEDDPPPPLPSATAAPVTAAPTMELAPEDAGVTVVDAGPDVKIGTGGGGKSTNLKKCCQAIKQNAANAPMPTKAYLENLAASCFAMAGQGGASFPAGAAYSPACK
jgi:hypothetical protein